MNTPPDKFRDRVVTAAEAALKADGSVGPLELFQQMGLLHPVHVEGWRKGNEHYRVLEDWIQVGPAKFEKALGCFREWVQERGLRPIEANYTRRTPGGIEPLQVTADDNPEQERLYRTHYAPAELTERKTRKLAEKLAVIAHVRHEHTDYDELLMQGTDRLEARALVRDQIDRVLESWSHS